MSKLKVCNLLFDVLRYLKMTALANTSILLHNYQFSSAVRSFTIHSIGNFQVHSTVLLTTDTTPYIRPLQLSLIAQRLYL